MYIKWYGHACFYLEQDGYSIVADPFTNVPGYADLHLTANDVTASHSHFDHCYFEAVELAANSSKTILTETIDCFHDNCGGKERGKNKIFIFKSSDTVVVHLGDIGHLLDESQIKKLYRCDVLLVPVGGFYTVGPEMAYGICKQIGPKVIIPMHFRYEGKGLEKVGPVEPFLNMFPKELIKYYPSGEITITKDTEKQIAVLK